MTRGELTRAGVAKAIRRSIATVRRLEGNRLTPRIDERGIHRFDCRQVEALSAEMALTGCTGLGFRTVPPAEPLPVPPVETPPEFDNIGRLNEEMEQGKFRNAQAVVSELHARMRDSHDRNGSVDHGHGGAVYMIRIGPALAGGILDFLNEDNIRKLRAQAAERFARDMSSGAWQPNFDSVSFCNGRLKNGQHRMYGVMKSGTEQMFLVVWNAPVSADRGTDIGAKRNAFATHGINKSVRACCGLMLYMRDAVHEPTNEECFQEYEAHRTVYDAINARSGGRSGIRRRSVTVAFAFAMLGCDHRDQYRCIELMKNISELELHDDASRLIAKIVTQSRGASNTRAETIIEAYRILRGIRAHLDREKILVLRGSPESARSFLPNARVLN